MDIVFSKFLYKALKYRLLVALIGIYGVNCATFGANGESLKTVDDLAFGVINDADEVVAIYENYYNGNQTNEEAAISQPVFKLVNSHIQRFLETVESSKQEIYTRLSGEKLSVCKASFQRFDEGTLKLLLEILNNQQSIYKGYTNGLTDHLYAAAQDFAVYTVPSCR